MFGRKLYNLPLGRPQTQKAVRISDKDAAAITRKSGFAIDTLVAHGQLDAWKADLGGDDELFVSEEPRVGMPYDLAAVGGVMDEGSATLVEIQTLGASGLRYRHRLGRGVSAWKTLDAIAAPRLADTCGSGDWCTAGLIAKAAEAGLSGLKAGGAKGLDAALRYGQTLAAWNCGFEGARGGMYAVEPSRFGTQIAALHSGAEEVAPVTQRGASTKAIACPACPPDMPRVSALKRKAA